MKRGEFVVSEKARAALARRLPIEALRHPDVPFIYVARTWVRPERGADWAEGWKVGRTTHLPQRIRSIVGPAGWLTLCAVGLGDYAEEREIHQLLVGSRGTLATSRFFETREWYRDTEEFRAWFATFDAKWRGSVRCEAIYDREARSAGSPWFLPVQQIVLDIVNAERRPKAAALMPRSRKEVASVETQGWLFR